MMQLTHGERFILATIVVVLVLLVCSGCGGGNSAAAVAPQRTDIFFGYYGDCDGCIAETKNHVNLAFVFGWGAGADPLGQHMLEANAAGLKVILGVNGRGTEGELRGLLTHLRTLNVLSSVVALYPMDEPDVHGMSPGQVFVMCEWVRRIASEFSELEGVKLAAIYGTVGSNGIEYFDWVGRDDYGKGPIKLILLPHQRMLFIAGGANPWREDPESFINAANATPSVIGILVFVYKWPGNFGAGVAENGMLPVYCAAGRLVIGREGTCG
jgi:hypothetical protein